MTALSTVIPTHNGARYLGEALESIAAQSLKPIEVIVVDDGSTDNTAEVVESRRALLPNLTYVRQEQRGASAARNAGAARASGDVLHFFDADDLLLPDFNLHMVSVLSREPLLGAACCQRFYQYGASERRYAVDRCWVRELPLAIAMQMDNPLDTLSTVMWRSVFEELGGFNEAFPIIQDVELAHRLVARWPAEVSPERHVVYRQHGRGVSSSGVGTTIERLLQAEQVAAADHDTYGVLIDTYLQYWLAEFFVQAGRLDEAEERLTWLLAASPEHAAGCLLRVRVLLARDRVADARAEAETLQARFPDCAPVVAALGRVRDAEGTPEQATALLREAIGLDLDDVERQRHELDLADLLVRCGNVDEATAVRATVYEDADAPDVRPRALAGLALMQVVSGRRAEADALLSAEPDGAISVRARYNMGSQLEEAGYLDEAIDAFKPVAASSMACETALAAGAHYHLGMLHASAGEGERAWECFEECVRLNPAHRRAASMLEELARARSGGS